MKATWLPCFLILLHGCSPKQIPQGQSQVRVHVRDAMLPRVIGETNIQHPRGGELFVEVFDPKGRSKGTYGGPIKEGRVELMFAPLPQGSYLLSTEHPMALRRVIRVDYKPFGPVYDFNLVLGDADSNGVIDERDLALIRRQIKLFKPGDPWRPDDLNGDRRVDETDLNIARANLGRRGDALP